MVVLERTYTIPLRKEYQKAPMYRRAKKAVIALREFLVKHMKSSEVKLGPQLNHAIWVRGIKHPPHHVKVTAVRTDDGVVKAELFGVKWEEKKPQPTEEKKGKKAEAEHVHAEGEEYKREHKHEEKAEAKAEKPVVAPKKEAAEKKPAEKKAASKETKAPADKKPAAKKAAKKE
ncbi:60S ribosomal protein L31 [Candidatus Woesearchaeota archaeon]|nr:60S ribosomal protein L31 [Candidatus Woesearchaeota archaeon]